MKILANYIDERAAFKRLLDQHCDHRIVMFQGESGSGKTALIEACRELLPADIISVAMDLRGSNLNVTEILSRTVVKMGGLSKLDHFSKRLLSLSQVPSLNLSDNTLRGTHNQIKVVVQNTAPVERQERYVQLTDAWFEDLAQMEHPLVLMLDTFEQANEEVQDWIGGSLLSRTADAQRLRVLLSGQKLPAKRIDWSLCCEMFELDGVKEAENWLPVVEGYCVPADDPLSFLTGLCVGLKGHPGKIMQIIKTLPRKH